MDLPDKHHQSTRDPLTWAADCSSRARSESDPQARDAYTQLADEFESVAAEIEGLIGTFEALAKRKQPAT